jgi:hypothetical protein
MAIIDSVRKLAEKVGADTNGRTIADQLNIINQKLDNTQPGSRDIAEAVSKFAEKEDGTATFTTKTITENGTYAASDDGVNGYSSVSVDVGMNYNRIITRIPISETVSTSVGIVNPSDSNGTFNVVASTSGQLYNVSNFTLTSAATKVNVTGAPGMRIVFTPSENFDGFYYGNTKLTMNGDTVTNGDGKAYVADVSLMSNTVTITKGGNFVYIVE